MRDKYCNSYACGFDIGRSPHVRHSRESWESSVFCRNATGSPLSRGRQTWKAGAQKRRNGDGRNSRAVGFAFRGDEELRTRALENAVTATTGTHRSSPSALRRATDRDPGREPSLADIGI